MSWHAPGLVPVHIGQPEPGSESERTLLARRERMRDRYGGPRRPRLPGGLDWQKHGLEPRWLGMETSDCSVAVEPGFSHNHGADERERFLAGARLRGELALVVAVIGDVDDDSPRSVLSHFDSSIYMNNTYTRINGRLLPEGSRPEIEPNLSPADRDLAIRLLNRPKGSPWWSLHLAGVHLERGGESGSVDIEPEGHLHPILVDALGDPVVAAWSSQSDDQRWYVIPDATDWDNVLGWLTHRALPEFVPDALRRARSTHFVDPDLLTTNELAIRRDLVELETRYDAEKLRLEQDLRDAEASAEPVRYGLLYGTGAQLVHAVSAVLTAAGLETRDLDEAFGATKSADLLVSDGGPPRRLVEVKATSGAAQENLVGHLQRHLDTWPQLRPDEPVAGGVLVVNHQHRLHPSERTAHVYSRPEFVAALPVVVVSTVDLFKWWRAADWSTIRTAVLGPNSFSAKPSVLPHEAAADPAVLRTSRWRLGRRRWISGRWVPASVVMSRLRRARREGR